MAYSSPRLLASIICMSQSAFAKTAKECTAEWRADKAGMQARGTTEKAYVEQCKGGAEPTAAAPAAKPAEAAPPASATDHSQWFENRQGLHRRMAG